VQRGRCVSIEHNGGFAVHAAATVAIAGRSQWRSRWTWPRAQRATDR
jgi:hypothetical protein